MKNFGKKEWLSVSATLAFIGLILVFAYSYIMPLDNSTETQDRIKGSTASQGQNVERQKDRASSSQSTTSNTNLSKKFMTKDIKEGTGQEAQKGDTVTVHYVGTLTDGEVFDSSRKRNQPFSFTLGEGRVIEGWEKGVVGMKEGGIRELTVPPELGYGQAPGHPLQNKTLIFEVELLEVEQSE